MRARIGQSCDSCLIGFSAKTICRGLIDWFSHPAPSRGCWRICVLRGGSPGDHQTSPVSASRHSRHGDRVYVFLFAAPSAFGILLRLTWRRLNCKKLNWPPSPNQTHFAIEAPSPSANVRGRSRGIFGLYMSPNPNSHRHALAKPESEVVLALCGDYFCFSRA